MFGRWFKKNKKVKKVVMARFCGKINHAQLSEGGQLSSGQIFNMTAYDELSKDHVELTSLNRGPFRNAFMELANRIVSEKDKRVVVEVREEDE